MELKNNKGFTLIEILITITLLAIVSIISFVSINNIINKNKDNECTTTINNIILAAKEYYSDKRYTNTLEIDNNTITITLSYLINNHYLKGEIIDPYEKTPLNTDEISIKIFLNTDKTIDTVKVTKDNNDIFNNCNK